MLRSTCEFATSLLTHIPSRVTNVGSIRPPPTTKVGITAKGGFQAEAHYFLCGLDIEEKAEMLEAQVRYALDESKFHCLKFRTNGRSPENPSSQDAATVDLRIFAQSKEESNLSHANFFRPVTDAIMQSYPGATFAVDARQALPKPYYEYWVALLPQSAAKHICHVPYKGLEISIETPSDTEDFVYDQSKSTSGVSSDLSSFGPTTRAPLGYVVHARSGDKGSDCNVGFFVRKSDEWAWLQSLLTVDVIRNLLGNDDTGKPIYRFELPNIWGMLKSSFRVWIPNKMLTASLLAVHFLLKDHLDRGVASSSTYDVLGKNLAEYLRCKYVDIPNQFLERGRI